MPFLLTVERNVIDPCGNEKRKGTNLSEVGYILCY
jgi:hypothetical protein